MLDRSLHMLVLMKRAVKRPKRGAFEHKQRLAWNIRQRMSPQWWPFNAPRPQHAHLWTITSPSESTLAGADTDQTEDEAPAEEAEIHTATALEVQDVTGSARLHSWRKTPLSKIKEWEPTPEEILFGSIDEAIAEEMFLPKGLLDSTKEAPANIGTLDAGRTGSIGPLTHRSSSGIGTEISKMIETAWKAEYEWVQDIKRGAQGDVSLFTQKETGKLTVIKTIRTDDYGHMTHLVDGVPHEAKYLMDYIKPHPNLVEMKTIFNDPKTQTCRIVMDYCDGGDLYDFTDHWLCIRRQQIPEVFLLHFIASIGEALAWLHLGKTLVSPAEFGLPMIVQRAGHTPILHRDIKLENIFLRLSPFNPQGLPYIVLGDFGGAVLESECDDWFGTPGYFPPEVQRYQQDNAQGSRHLLQRKFQVMTAASDIYTFAATFCRMILLGTWEQDMEIDRVFWSSKLNDWGLLREFMRESLDDNPRRRPSTETLLDLAAVIKAHVAAAYHCGVTMPMGSWPTKRATRDDGPSASGSTVVPNELSIIDAYRIATSAANADRASSAILPTQGALAAAPVAAAAEIERPEAPTPEQMLTRRKSSVTNPRLTVLFEIVERMANQFPGFSRGSSMRRSISSWRRNSKTRGTARGSLPLISPPQIAALARKFSGDGDVSPLQLEPTPMQVLEPRPIDPQPGFTRFGPIKAPPMET